MSNSVSHPLTLILPLLDDVNAKEVLGYLGQANEAIYAALDDIGTVHHARFVLLDARAPNLKPSPDLGPGRYKLAVITTYDDDFDSYLLGFVEHLSGTFDTLLRFTAGGARLIPVQEHAEELVEWVRENDASQQGGRPPTQYGAYPTLSVQDIKAKFGL